MFASNVGHEPKLNHCFQAKKSVVLKKIVILTVRVVVTRVMLKPDKTKKGSRNPGTCSSSSFHHSSNLPVRCKMCTKVKFQIWMFWTSLLVHIIPLTAVTMCDDGVLAKIDVLRRSRHCGVGLSMNTELKIHFENLEPNYELDFKHFKPNFGESFVNHTTTQKPWRYSSSRLASLLNSKQWSKQILNSF